MGSFKEVQDMLLLSSKEKKIIDDEEFPLLYEAYMPQNSRPFLMSPYEYFSIVNRDLLTICKADFLVKKRDVTRVEIFHHCRSQ